MLIKALIKTESNFDRKAISSKALHVTSSLDPEENITGCTKYLRSLLDNYNGNIELTLAAYNAGPTNVKDRVPDIPETKHYVSTVISHYKQYQQRTK